jgi:PAS domain S-box-containing protein
MILKDPAFRIIFENAPVGISVVDASLTIIDANAAYCAMLGYSKDDLVGRRVPDFTHPDDRQRDVEFLPLLLTGQIPYYRAEKRYIHRDGHQVWAKFTATALMDVSGRMALYAFAMVEDVTRERTLDIHVCPSCQKVRDDRGYWNKIDVWLRQRAATDLTASLCPDCARQQGRGPGQPSSGGL